MKSYNFLLAITACLIFASAGPVNGFELPAGWKQAKIYKNSSCREGGVDIYTAQGDFDGDNKVDVARVLAKSKGKGVGLWVWLTTQPQPILAEVMAQADGEFDIGIGVAAPGIYKTACGKGYWPCKGDEMPKLTLRNAAIDSFYCESANHFLVWSAKNKKFESIWMSD